MSDLFPRTWLPLALGACLLPLAAFAADRPNLSGSWRMDPAKSELRSARLTGLNWVIDQKDDALRISETARHADGKEVKSNFDCTTDGKECSIKEDGQAAKVSFWYNGPTLVEMEMKGRNREIVVKKTLQLSSDGKQMSVELISVVGAEPSGKLVFEKQ